MVDLTIGYISGLAIADAVNPCAIAVLALVLLSIMTFNPRDKKKILLSGIAFVAAVFILYLLYGLVIIQFFKFFKDAVSGIQIYLYKVLGILAIILGILNIKDFFKYKPGGFATEMPLWMRPHAKKLISKITSPKGAFFLGVFVTLFLLPCTIGPYLIAAGILSALDLVNILPWLLYYNIIFVLPMVGITLIVYLGYATVEKVSGWKEENIKYLHLITGIIFILLGILLVIF